MPSSIEDLSPPDREFLAAARRDLYALLSGLLTDAPSPRLAEALRDDSIAPLLTPFAEDESIERLRAAVAATALPDLRQEFWDVFAVPGGRFVAPFQSVYVDVREIEGEPVKGLTMGASALLVQKAYAEAGFEVDSRRPLPPDHVGVELGFLAHLCEREREAWATGQTSEAVDAAEAAAGFAGRHVGRWLPLLRERVIREAETDFYPEILSIACRLATLEAGQGRCFPPAPPNAS